MSGRDLYPPRPLFRAFRALRALTCETAEDYEAVAVATTAIHEAAEKARPLNAADLAAQILIVTARATSPSGPSSCTISRCSSTSAESTVRPSDSDSESDETDGGGGEDAKCLKSW